MCDIIWCKKAQADGKPCDTINYLDPYCFWNWKGKINCAECGTVYYIHMIQGLMYKGPDEQPAGTSPTPARCMPTSLWKATSITPRASKAGPGRSSACPGTSTWGCPTW